MDKSNGTFSVPLASKKKARPHHTTTQRRGGGHWAAFSLTPGFLQIEVGHGRKAIVIFVPVPLLGGWHRSQQR